MAKRVSIGRLCGVAISISLVATPLPALAQLNSKAGKTAEKTRAKAQAELPNCARPLGTLALAEPETKWWGGLGLGSPEALIRVYVQKSKCFRLVNRSNRGMESMQRERDLAGGGELRRGGVVGKGQMVEADFTMIPDIVTGNANKGGFNVGGLVGGIMGGTLGGIVGGISIKKKSANVVLNVVNNKTSEEYVAEGQSKKSDLGFGGGGGFFGGGALGGAAVGGYDSTELGQVVALAYLDAYARLVADLGGMEAAINSAPAAEKALTLGRPGRLFATPSLQGKVIKTLDAGAILYPTGQRAPGFREVEDEIGSKGWVSEASLQVAR